MRSWSARQGDIPHEIVLRGTRHLWELTDERPPSVAAARHIDLEIARREEQQRLTFLARVLSGTLSPT